MFYIERFKKRIRIKEVWFSTNPSEIDDCDVVIFNQLSKPYGRVFRESDTQIINLFNSEEAIVNEFSKTTKYEIRKSSNLNMFSVIKDSDQLSEQELSSMIDEYYIFLNEKHLPLTNKQELLSSIFLYRNKRALTVSYGFYEGNCLCWHVYIHDDTTTRLLYSFSHFRSNDFPKNYYSILNRRMHFDDIKYFKDKGLNIYDWGGIGNDGQFKTISQFKTGFGGYSTHVYYCVKGKTFIGKIASMFKK